MELRRWMMALGAGALLLTGPACQKSPQERANDERKDVAEARKDVREDRQDLAKEQREHQNDAAKATRDEREDLAKDTQKERKEESEAARAAREANEPTTSVSGRVVKSSDDELVVRPAGKDSDLKLKVGTDTSVMVDGKRASLDQLREGSQVRASYSSDKDGERHATKIELQR